MSLSRSNTTNAYPRFDLFFFFLCPCAFFGFSSALVVSPSSLTAVPLASS